MLNPIQIIVTRFEEVYLICNNVMNSMWDYYPNIKLINVGAYLPIREFEKRSTSFVLLEP